MIKYTQRLEIAQLSMNLSIAVDAKDFLNGDVPEVIILDPGGAPVYLTLEQAAELGQALTLAAELGLAMNGDVTS